MSDVKILWKALQRIPVEEARRALDEKGVDPVVGIAIAELNADSIEFEGQSYRRFAARVFPSKPDGGQPYVTPHLHKVGCEPYYFLDGNGEMHLGHLSPDGLTCRWLTPIGTEKGGRWLILENEVHSFRNIGTTPSDFLFACPLSHLMDHTPEQPEGDRYVMSSGLSIAAFPDRS